MGQLEPIGVQDRDLSGVVRYLRLGAPADTEPLGRLSEQRLQVERHVATLGRDAFAAALDQVHEAAVRPAVRLFPERLCPRPSKQLFGSPHGELLQSDGGGPGERLRARRQGLLQLALHVAIRIEPVRQEGRDPALNRLILEQLAARLGPVLGVEQLPIRP